MYDEIKVIHIHFILQITYK